MQTRSVIEGIVEQLLGHHGRVALGIVGVGMALLLVQLLWRSTDLVEPNIDNESAGDTAMASSAPVSSDDGQRTALRNPFSGTTEGAAEDFSASIRLLELVGVVAIGEKSVAVIASDVGEGAFSVGDTVPGGATVSAVFTDHVILERRGERKTLWLSNNRGGSSVVDAASISDSGHDSPELPVSLTDYRGRFFDAPGDGAVTGERFSTSELVEYFQPVKTASGELMGFQLAPNRRDAQFQELGLMPGDVITTVNGIPLSQEENSVRGLRRLRGDGLASVTLIRDRNKIIDITLMRDSASESSQ